MIRRSSRSTPRRRRAIWCGANSNASRISSRSGSFTDTAKAALRAGADYLVHSVADAPVDDEFIRLARANHALLCPTLFVVNGYQYALSNRWQASPEEQRLADPQILAAMHDLDRMPKDLIPERVTKSMADATPPPAPALALN